MTTQPLVSVVVPTHNRRAAVLRCLKSLAEQTVSRDLFEVVVVADSCRDDTESAVEAYAAQAPFGLRLVSHAARSAAATRNLGAATAIGSILLFLDDDMVASARLLEAHLAALQDADVSVGYSRPALPTRPTRWQRDARRWWEDRFHAMAATGHRFSYEDLFSGNLALRAELFNSLGGFDVSFAGRLEDYELGVRLIKSGAKFCFSYSAAAAHFDQSDLDTWVRRVRLDGGAHVLLARHYPELRGALFGYVQIYAGPEVVLLRALAFAAPQRGDTLLRLALLLIRLCEGMGMQRSRGRLLRLTREYNYWRGVAAEVGAPQVRAWLDAASLPVVAGNAPSIDLAALPPEPELATRLALGAERGVRLLVGGAEAARLAPQPGAEPLRVEHLRRALQTNAHSAVLPAVALQMIISGEMTCWPASLQSI